MLNGLGVKIERYIRDENEISECSIRDESRPLGIGVQAKVPNRLLVLWSKAMVLSVKGKGWKTSQVRANEAE